MLFKEFNLDGIANMTTNELLNVIKELSSQRNDAVEKMLRVQHMIKEDNLRREIEKYRLTLLDIVNEHCKDMPENLPIDILHNYVGILKPTETNPKWMLDTWKWIISFCEKYDGAFPTLEQNEYLDHHEYYYIDCKNLKLGV